jgi:hypothetical protein
VRVRAPALAPSYSLGQPSHSRAPRLQLAAGASRAFSPLLSNASHHHHLVALSTKQRLTISLRPPRLPSSLLAFASQHRRDRSTSVRTASFRARAFRGREPADHPA